MTTFYLVRHAHATWTPDENRPLSERGQHDALRVAGLLGERPVAAIYASPARRAQQTVAPLAERLALPLRIEPALSERRLSATPVSASAFQSAVRATWADPNRAYPGGETHAAAQARGLVLVRSLAARHPDAQIVLGTHGVLLALIVQGLLPGYGYPFWLALTMPDVYRLDLPVAGHDAARTPALERVWGPTYVG